MNRVLLFGTIVGIVASASVVSAGEVYVRSEASYGQTNTFGNVNVRGRSFENGSEVYGSGVIGGNLGGSFLLGQRNYSSVDRYNGYEAFNGYKVYNGYETVAGSR